MTSYHSKKLKPAYLSDLSYYPKANPIFIAVNWGCLNFIRNHRGICLLCNKNHVVYDLSFCSDKEIWVLYSQAHEFSIAKQLGNALLLHGSTEVRILPAPEESLFEELNYA